MGRRAGYQNRVLFRVAYLHVSCYKGSGYQYEPLVWHEVGDRRCPRCIIANVVTSLLSSCAMFPGRLSSYVKD